MSDNEDASAEKQFFVDVAKQSRATCKKCKQKCVSGEARIAKLAPNPFGDGKMKTWHHVECIFEQFLKQRPTTKRIESPDDVDGWDSIVKEEQKKILKFIEESEQNISKKYNLAVATPKKPTEKTSKQKKKNSNDSVEEMNKDMLFKTFRRLVCEITNVSAYTEKTAKVHELFSSFKGDIKLWCRLLLPGVVKRIYNLQSKQLIKLFSRIFKVGLDDMMTHLEKGDVAETISDFFTKSNTLNPLKKSNLTLVEIDAFLEELSTLTKEDEQMENLKIFTEKCTENDLKITIRLIKHDLRMNAGAKHILDGVHPEAYQAYQSCRDLDAVIDRCIKKTGAIDKKLTLLSPILPMLAQACKNVEQAMTKFTNGIYAEIKYDGERIQVHKQDNIFKYYTRNLKPVLPHKIAQLKDYIPLAFPHGKDLLLDAEILMIDVNGKILPFGSLGVHKKNEFKDANVCMFIFDCVYFNGEDLTEKPLRHRKDVLKNNMKEIKNRVLFSEMEEIHDVNELKKMIAKVLKLGLEGLVLKDIEGKYEPGKRHWMKVKKDYLFDGAMADSADLIVLGAWYGTGKKGGMMSVFLMGCYDKIKNKFCTVTKVHTGHDDKTLERLQSELDMIKISCDSSKIPSWLQVTKSMVPDFIAKDPKKQPVWEITGAEFTQHDVHTANGISIRFPRVTRIRDDKSWDSATNLQELEDLFEKSKYTDVSLLMQTSSHSNESSSNSTSKTSPERKRSAKESFPSKKKIKLGTNTAKNVDPEPSTSKIPTILNNINQIFKNVYLLIHCDAKLGLSRELRLFEKYGGNILGDNQWKQATHVLHIRDTENNSKTIRSPPNARHIIIEWIKDSIQNEALIDDMARYYVRLQPENITPDFL